MQNVLHDCDAKMSEGTVCCYGVTIEEDLCSEHLVASEPNNSALSAEAKERATWVPF